MSLKSKVVPMKFTEESCNLAMSIRTRLQDIAVSFWHKSGVVALPWSGTGVRNSTDAKDEPSSQAWRSRWRSMLLVETLHCWRMLRMCPLFTVFKPEDAGVQVDILGGSSVDRR